MNIYHIILTGLFTLAGVLLTWKLTSKRERLKFRQEVLNKRYNDVQEFYVLLMAMVDKVIRSVKEGKMSDELRDEISRYSARTNFVGTVTVNEKMQKVSDAIQNWSVVYRQFGPQRIGDTNLALISNQNSHLEETANLLFAEVKKAIGELSVEIKHHLYQLELGIEKVGK